MKTSNPDSKKRVGKTKKKIFSKTETLDEKYRLKNKKENFEIALSNIVANMPGHVYWKNKHGVYLGCNDRQARSLGFSNEDMLVGKTDFDLPWEAGVAEEFRKNDIEVMCTGIAQLIEEPSQMEGQEVIVLSQKTPLKDKNGEIIGVLGISLDITDRKKMEADLKLAKEKAEAANEAKSDFISNMEHDLRTPFTGISGVANLIKDRYKDKYPELCDWLQIMTTSCSQWEKVHNRIFDILVLEQTKPVNLETVLISEELFKIEEMMAALLKTKNLSCEIAPIPKEIDKIKTDKFKFNTILSNLFSNAINFTEKGGIKVSVARERADIVLKVTDTGMGIPADKFEYIFEKFTKLSRSNKHADDFRGVGIGLYAARKYATQLGMHIEVESKLGVGSTFILKWPIKMKRT